MNIFRAVIEINIDEVRRIVNADKNAVNARGIFGKTPIWHASSCRYGPLRYDIANDIAAFLIEHGADVNCVVPNHSRPTPLHIATEQGNARICRLLLANGADTSLKNSHGKTAEEIASSIEIRDLIRNVAEAKSRKSQDKDQGKKPPSADNLYSKKLELAQLRHKLSVDMAELDLEVVRRATAAQKREAETVKELERLKAQLVLDKAQRELELEKFKEERVAKELEAKAKIQVVSEEVQQLEEERRRAAASSPKNPTEDSSNDEKAPVAGSSVSDGSSVDSFIQIKEEEEENTTAIP